MPREYVNAIVKFNGGRGALLCNSCRTIIAYGVDHDDKEHVCSEGCEAGKPTLVLTRWELDDRGAQALYLAGPTRIDLTSFERLAIPRDFHGLVVFSHEGKRYRIADLTPVLPAGDDDISRSSS